MKIINSIYNVTKKHWALFGGGLIGAFMLMPIAVIALTNYLAIMGLFWVTVFVLLVCVESLRL